MSAIKRTYVVEAAAKINLTLEILGKRADGYHELRSVVTPVALADQISLTLEGSEIALTVSGNPGVDLTRIGSNEENLAYRAARLLQERHGAAQGIRIDILKRIPIGGGLGGGSADAAAVLVGLNKICGLGLSLDTLKLLGAELGSDIPALIMGGAVVMTGRGEHVASILPAGKKPVSGFWVVIANPGIFVSTAHAYRICNPTGGLTERPDAYKNIISSIRSGDVHSAAAALFNGLEPGVFAAYPETARLAERLQRAGGLGVLLSGSGASVFALVRDASHGEALRRDLGSGIWSVLTKTLPDGVMVAHGPLEP